MRVKLSQPTYRVDKYDILTGGIAEELGTANHFTQAMQLYESYCDSYPEDNITLRQRARVLREQKAVKSGTNGASA